MSEQIQVANQVTPDSNETVLDDLIRDHYYTWRGVRYKMTEASGDAVRQWRNAVIRASITTMDGKSIMKEGFPETETLLVQLCLTGPEGKKVPFSEVSGWPHRIQAEMFKKALELSNLNEKETEATLAEKISALNEKLEQMRKDKEEGAKKEDPAKN